MERVLEIRRNPGGEVRALVRWAGSHPDTWEPLVSFSGDGLRDGVIGLRPKRRRLERMANAVLGSPPARAGSRPARVRVQPTRGMGDVSPFFARLVRGSDARVFRAGRKRGLISLGTSRQHLQEDDNWSDPLQDAGLSEDGQGRRGRRSIVADSDDEEEPHDSADLRPGQVVSEWEQEIAD